MCGLFGYLGKKQAAPIIKEGLKKLEYRGYDSCGLVVIYSGRFYWNGSFKNVDDLQHTYEGNVGIGHTRWSTSGTINEAGNIQPIVQHPVALAHNGTILDKFSLREGNLSDTYWFAKALSGSTKKTIFGNFIDRICFCSKPGNTVTTLYLNIMDKPNHMMGSRLGTPLIIGKTADGDYYFASDTTAFPSEVTHIIDLEDGDVFLVSLNTDTITINNVKTHSSKEYDWKLFKNHKHPIVKTDNYYMLSEIEEQKNFQYTNENLLVERSEINDEFIFVGCGSSYYAALYGKEILDPFLDTRITVYNSTELSNNPRLLNKHYNAFVLYLSQSGETYDTLQSLTHKFVTGCVTNNSKSELFKRVNLAYNLNIGPEISVAATKSFLAQCIWFESNKATHNINLGYDANPELKRDLESLLGKNDGLISLANSHLFDKFLFLGQGSDYPIAMEGALKLKEVAYVHAEGMYAAEIKHGPLALVDSRTLVFVLDNTYNQTTTRNIHKNIDQIRTREGTIVYISNSYTYPHMYDFSIFARNSMLSIIPLQQFAYYKAINIGLNPDRPRNLAKSITV